MTAQAGPKSPVGEAFDAFQLSRDYMEIIDFVHGVTKPSAILYRAFRAGWAAGQRTQADLEAQDV